MADRCLHRWADRGRADGRDGHGDLFPRHGRPRARHLDEGDDRHRFADGLRHIEPAHGRQALHGRRRRQDHAAAGSAGGGLRRRSSAAVGAWARPYRRDPRQARVDTRLARAPEQRRDAGSAERSGRGDLRCGQWVGPGRPEALRAARCHSHGGVDSADRQLDHEQEDRRRCRVPGAGCESRQLAHS